MELLTKISFPFEEDNSRFYITDCLVNLKNIIHNFVFGMAFGLFRENQKVSK